MGAESVVAVNHTTPQEGALFSFEGVMCWPLVTCCAKVNAWQQFGRSPHDALNVPSTRLSTVGDCAFPVAAARVWNSLPATVTSSPSLLTFKKRLKTELFARSYPDCQLWLHLTLVSFFLSASLARLFHIILFCKVSSKSSTLCHLNLFV